MTVNLIIKKKTCLLDVYIGGHFEIYSRSDKFLKESNCLVN